MNSSEKLHLMARELTNLNNIVALLQWDQEVMMPADGAAGRAAQLAALSTIVHQKITDPALGDTLHDLAARVDGLPPADQALVRVIKRAYDKNIKLPEKFVADFAKLTSEALSVWGNARKQNDFKQFLPLLERVISMSREQAAFLGFHEHPYDALLDLYEEGLNCKMLDTLFGSLRVELSRILLDKASRENTVSENLAGIQPMELQDQVRFSERLLSEMGYDFNRGRQDISAHPFTTSLGHNDRRVTNRFSPHSLEFIFSALHEGGHALYEQNITAEYADTPLDDGISLGIHESQSRLWENIIGRSRHFWKKYFPVLQEFLPHQFKDMCQDAFILYINRVQPGLIRVEADEVSYNLHVLIRYELEKGLIGGTIRAADLPYLWNEKYKNYLGVTVDSDANGVLQDIHWAHGSFGYFPTYTIGNLAAAQIWNTYCQFDADFMQTLQRGNLAKIREWLTENIYRHGAFYPPAELLRQVCGEPLNSIYFLDYLKNKAELSL